MDHGAVITSQYACVTSDSYIAFGTVGAYHGGTKYTNFNFSNILALSMQHCAYPGILTVPEQDTAQAHEGGSLGNSHKACTWYRLEW